MNQKLNLSQIKEIRQHYKDDEIYKIVKTVVCPAETNFKSFEFSAEACFVNVMDILSQIRDKTIRVEDVHNLWHQTTNDFFRDDHSANKEEIKQAVSMSFLFVAQALSTSKWPIYNYHLARQFIETVAAETESLTEEYNKIIDLTFPDCWFDYFMRGEYQEQNNLSKPFSEKTDNSSFSMPSAAQSPGKTTRKKQTAKTHTEKQHGIDYPVFSKGTGVTDAHIKLLFHLLAKHCWIDANNNAESQFMLLFKGGQNMCEVKFTGKHIKEDKTQKKLGKAAIYQLFKTLWDENLIETDKEKKTKVGPILETHLTDMRGRFLTNISGQNNVSADAEKVIRKAVRILTTKPDTDDINSIIETEGLTKYDRYNR